MSILMALAASGGGGQPPITKTFVYTGAAQSFTVPAGVTNLASVSGQGGTGSPATSQSFQSYSYQNTVYTQDSRNGGTITTSPGASGTGNGPTPSNYCDPVTHTEYGTYYIARQICVAYTNTSTSYSTPATTGAATTGFGLSFPGGYGGAANTMSYPNVAVVAGQNYPLSIPVGGSITISYYA